MYGGCSMLRGGRVCPTRHTTLHTSPVISVVYSHIYSHIARCACMDKLAPPGPGGCGCGRA
eukprot:scaffold9936_cov130-Isochrysis_galbana.AAC.9